MAEKKFFVDINLQGNQLFNAKIGANSNMGVGGAFQYNDVNGRLEYSNGSLVEEIANLSDISAVTGGLIFQGGYDALNDTPSITTDANAKKGYFWVVSTAGNFLGESVQVGDSIIAKTDAPLDNNSDWLILQGNVVIATDTVDGIVRLATQTEANDGTESGAVVITPATLQGKIDAQITPEINDKLSKQGGTMSGNIDMANWAISNVTNLSVNDLSNNDGNITFSSNLSAAGGKIINLPAPTDEADAANKLYVDTNTNDKLPLAGGTMSGSINTAGYPITNLPEPTQGDYATNKDYVDGAASTAQANAEATASADATAKADAAQTAAEAYADSLAPNYDAAGSAATAESNANAYTDEAIANTKVTATVLGSNSGTSGWSLVNYDGSFVYMASVDDYFGSQNKSVTTMIDNKLVEFEVVVFPSTTYIYSNVEPSSDTIITILR